MVTGTSYTILSLPSSPEFPARVKPPNLAGHILLSFGAIFGTLAHFVVPLAKPPNFSLFFRPFAQAP